MTAKIRLSNRSKKIAVQPLLFFFFSSFLSLRSLYFPFPCSFLGGFSGSFCLRLLVFFSHSKDCNFRTVRSKKSSKIMLCRLLRYTSLTFLKLSFRFLLVKSEWRGGEDIVNGTYSSHKNFGSSKRLFQENEIV